MTSSVYSRQGISKSPVSTRMGPIMHSQAGNLPLFGGYGDPGDEESPRSSSRGRSGSSGGSSRSRGRSTRGGGEDEEYIGMGGTFSENQQALGTYRGGLEKTAAGRHHLYGKPSNEGSEMGLGPFTRLFAAVQNGQVKGLDKGADIRHLMGVSTQMNGGVQTRPTALREVGDPYIARLNAAHQDHLARTKAAQAAPAASAAPNSTNKNGYGAFLNLPPGSRVDRRFVDSDGDGIDDRYQTGPGQPRGGGTRPNVPVRPTPIRPTPPSTPTSPSTPPAPPSLPNNPSSGINWKKRPRRRA